MPASYAVLSSRLSWLTACLAGKRNRIAGLLNQVSGLGVPAALKPSLFRKFLDMLDEVAAAREEEFGLIAQIEAVEQKHRFMRTHKKLKHVRPRAKIAAAFRVEDGPKAKPRRSFFDLLLLLILWLIVLWNMFPRRLLPRRKINQKKQGLTVN